MRGALYRAGYGLGILAAIPASLFSAKIRKGFWGRFGLIERVKAAKKNVSDKTYWFHVASSGELEQCLPILDEIKALRPNAQVFLSYFSPTAKRGIELEIARREKAQLPVPWDMADYSPFDFRYSVRRFLKVLNPTHFVAIHREIWPTILEECERLKVRRYLLSMYLPPASRPAMKRLSPWLKRFEKIGTTEAGTATFLKGLLGESFPVTVMGDPRIERVLKRKAMQKIPPWAGFFSSNVLILASLWPEDFQKISNGLSTLLGLKDSWKIIVVPHEPKESFVANCQKWFKAHGAAARRWSQWSQSPDEGSHLVVDGVGYLAELYQVATLVFVGGSFHKRVHNVLEPAAYGKPILTGPFIENSGEAMEMWTQAKALVRVSNSEEFARELLRLASDDSERHQLSEKLGAYLTARQGASCRYANLILER